MGSSIVRRASDHTASRPTGHHLGLDNYGYVVTWIGMGGMKIYDLNNAITGMINIKGQPDVILIHCGANDILNCPLRGVLYTMKVELVHLMHRVAPGTSIIYSEMLPRLKWLNSYNDQLVEKTRKRLNRGMRKFLLPRQCYIIRHPDFDDKYHGLFDEDRVHLSFIGNDIFINSLQGALETFLTKPLQSIYPA